MGIMQRGKKEASMLFVCVPGILAINWWVQQTFLTEHHVFCANGFVVLPWSPEGMVVTLGGADDSLVHYCDRNVSLGVDILLVVTFCVYKEEVDSNHNRLLISLSHHNRLSLDVVVVVPHQLHKQYAIHTLPIERPWLLQSHITK